MSSVTASVTDPGRSVAQLAIYGGELTLDSFPCPTSTTAADDAQRRSSTSLKRVRGSLRPEVSDKLAARTTDRYRLLDRMRNVTSIPRQARCGRSVHHRAAAPSVVFYPETGTAGFDGLAMCGSVHTCPVCSARIRNERARELQTAALGWLNRAGRPGSLAFGTFTLRHNKADQLGDLFEILTKAWRRMTSGREGAELRRYGGLEWMVSAREFTRGQSGWHPHLHVLFFLDGPVTEAGHVALGQAWFERWHECVEKVGGRAVTEDGFRWQAVEGVQGAKNLAEYLTKITDGLGESRGIAAEMLRGDLKGNGKGLQPFELLRIATATSETPERREWARLLWVEYEQATKGKACLTWSKGMRAALGLADEVADVDLAELPEPDPQVVYTFDLPAFWALVLARRKRGELLESARRGGRQGVVDFIDRLVWERNDRWGRQADSRRHVARWLACRPAGAIAPDTYSVDFTTGELLPTPTV